MAANGLVKTMSQMIKFMSEGKGFDRVLSKLTVVSACETGKISCELPVDEGDCNRGGTLHGGLTATIVDNVSTYAMLCAQHPPGVSTDINVSYFRAARPGATLLINASVLKAGQTLVFTTVDVIDKASNQLVAQGRHTKFIGGK